VAAAAKIDRGLKNFINLSLRKWRCANLLSDGIKRLSVVAREANQHVWFPVRFALVLALAAVHHLP
jgi:hypothetical protein